MDFKTVLYFSPLKGRSNGRVLNLVDMQYVLYERINDAMLMLEKWREAAASNVAILVNRGRQYRSAVLAEPPGIIGTTPEK